MYLDFKLFQYSNITQKKQKKFNLDSMSTIILGIESSCDDTSAAIIEDGLLLSNVIASQKVHEEYGGVVPELASRAHQQNIIPVVDNAIKKAGISKDQISAIAFTQSPGLLGSLMVGTSFAKGFSRGKNIPMIDVNHLQGHILASFLVEKGQEKPVPKFPFLCLLVSGGHTQIVKVNDYLNFEIIGSTIDDAAGEAFDKCAKVMGLPYPGGPVIDKYAKEGNSNSIAFAKPKIEGLNFSFSGLKTSFLYHLRDNIKNDNQYIEKNLTNLCASLQKTIIDILLDKVLKAVNLTGIKEISLSGGVSANSGLRNKFIEISNKKGWNLYLPELRYTTDNAAMIAITGYHKFQQGKIAKHDIEPKARI